MANKVATLLLRIKSAGEDVLDRVGAGLSKLKDLAVVSFAAISAAVVKSIEEYREAEEAQNALSRAMVNQGIYSKTLKDQYLAQAEALQALTTFGDDEIVNSQAILQSYLGQTKISKELTQSVLDLATAKKMDLASAADLVGKSVGGATNALARHGIEVNTNLSKQERLAQVMSGINEKYKGQAEAAASGLGVLKQLANLGGEIFEVIGQRIAPVITLFAGKLREVGTNTAIVTPMIDAFVSSLQFLTNTGVIISGVFEAVGKVIGTGFAAAIESVSAALEGRFGQAVDIAKTGVQESGKAITEAYQNTANRMKEVDAAFLAGKQENLAKEEQLEKESLDRRAIVKQEARTNDAIKQREADIEKLNSDIEMIGMSEEQKRIALIENQIATQEEIYKNAVDAKAKLEALNELHGQKEKLRAEKQRQQEIKDREEAGRTIATLANSNNKTLATIGKTAALTQIAIDTPVAVSKAYAAFPPPFNFAAAGAVAAAMAAQAAQVAGVQLAEGGIVMPRPGGVQATIAEAGQAEAVIPLDRAGEFGLGGGGANITLNVYGGLLGDASTARELARALDGELLKLRQNNESVSFDRGVI